MLTREEIAAAGLPKPQEIALDAGWYSLQCVDAVTRDYAATKDLPWKDGPEREAWILANINAGEPVQLGKQKIITLEVTEGPSAGKRIRAYITAVASSDDRGYDGKQATAKIEGMGRKSWAYLLGRLGFSTEPADDLELIGRNGSFFVTKKIKLDGFAKNYARLYPVAGDPAPTAARAGTPSPVQRVATLPASAGGPPF